VEIKKGSTIAPVGRLDRLGVLVPYTGMYVISKD